MCSTSKRSFGGDSDDDFDDSLHKRLKIRRKEPNLCSKGTGKAKQSRRRLQVRIQKVDNVSMKSTSLYSTSQSLIDSATSPSTPAITGNGSIVSGGDWREDGWLVVNDQNSDLNDSRLSADQIISDILGDECDDTTMSVADQSTTTATSTIEAVLRLPEVPSPKKQSSLFQYFKLKRGKSVSAPSSTGGITKNHLSASMHQSNSSSKTVLPKQSSIEASNSNFSKKSKRDCPFYKKIPGTTITVDAFLYGDISGCTAYFLSHFHSDHYGGLDKHFRNDIYCSSATGNLVCKKLGVASQHVHKLPLNTQTMVENVRVTLYDANHCPGSVMFLFVLPNGKVFLHTGDFRASQDMKLIPVFSQYHIDQLYLDTTYCSPKYDFPSQEDVVSFVVQKVGDTVKSNSKTLIVCGTYTIGKEKIFLGIADMLQSKVFVSKDKKEILDCLENSDLSSILTTSDSNSRVHVLPMMRITIKGMIDYLKKHQSKFNSILAFKPTGWTYSGSLSSLDAIKPQTSRQVVIYGVPYSEHSSFSELRTFVQFIRPTKIIPTVFGGAGQRINDMQNIFKEWLKK